MLPHYLKRFSIGYSGIENHGEHGEHGDVLLFPVIPVTPVVDST
jgi:hypothetical protein